MSRRSDRFKKILPTDVPRRGLDVTVSTKPMPNFEVGAVQGDSPGAAQPKPLSDKALRAIDVAGNAIRTLMGKPELTKSQLAEARKRAEAKLSAKAQLPPSKRKKTKAPRKVKNTDFRIRLDFTIRVEGDDVIPEIFGPKYMDFIAAGLLGTMLKAPKYKNRNVDVLPGSRLHVSVKQHKED